MGLKTAMIFVLASAVIVNVLFIVMFQWTQNSFDNDQSAGDFEQHKLRQSLNVSTSTTRDIVNDKEIEYRSYPGLIIPTHHPRYGPGEGGEKVKVPPKNTQSRVNIDKRYGFNTLTSDMISVHRKLADDRPEACKRINYPDDLPPVSVVILFRDEWPSVVLRTAYSVLETSPPHMLKEIVLVDDGSTEEDLISTIDIHVENVNKFKLIRNNVSLGLMKAGDIGIKATTSDYFIAKDGHMEVVPGWLEPLVYRLVQQPNSLLTSIVGTINLQTFETIIVSNYSNDFVYFYLMSLTDGYAIYCEKFLAPHSMNNVEPMPYAIYQGMITVMRKEFYLQLGGFDTGMKVWGSEQIELSVKVWMCGGRVEVVPCSLSAHLFRCFFPNMRSCWSIKQ